MPAERTVTVKVNLVAGGNVSAAMRANVAAAKDMGNVLGGGGVVGDKIKPKPAAKPKADDEGISNMAIFKGLALASGAIAAANPAIFETLMGSVKLAAGEIGIMLIPAVVQVAGFFQDLAGKIRWLNEVSGGTVGRLLSFGAVAALTTVVAYKVVTGLTALAAGAHSAAAALRGITPQGTGGGGIGGSIPIISTVVAAAEYLSDKTEGANKSAFENVMGNVSSFFGLNALTKANQIQGAAANATAVNMGFHGGSSEFAAFDRAIQSAGIRDPLQQRQDELTIRAMEEQLAELRRIRAALPPPPHEVNQ